MILIVAIRAKLPSHALSSSTRLFRSSMILTRSSIDCSISFIISLLADSISRNKLFQAYRENTMFQIHSGTPLSYSGGTKVFLGYEAKIYLVFDKQDTCVESAFQSLGKNQIQSGQRGKLWHTMGIYFYLDIAVNHTQ